MSNYTKAAAWVGFVISLVIGVHLLFSAPAYSGSVTSPSRSTAGTIVPQGMWGGLQIGPQSQVPLIKAEIIGTCTLTAANSSSLPLPATSTSQFNCAIGNQYYMQPGDLAQVTLSNGHASGFGAFDVVDAVASSTASGQNGIITVTILNNVGAATSTFPLATTSAQFEINRI